MHDETMKRWNRQPLLIHKQHVGYTCLMIGLPGSCSSSHIDPQSGIDHALGHPTFRHQQGSKQCSPSAYIRVTYNCYDPDTWFILCFTCMNGILETLYFAEPGASLSINLETACIRSIMILVHCIYALA